MRPGPFRPTCRIGADENEMGQPLRVASGILHCHRSPLRHSQQGKSVELEGIDNRL